MSNYSPYIYQINEFKSTDIDSSKWREAMFDYFTLLTKPVQRNTYKISLAQILHYCIDFGIGYNSVCITTVTTQQEFTTTMYVNRHYSKSDNRPATITELKEKILDIVEILVRETVKNGNGIAKKNKLYPKYIFTLDANLTAEKLKLITGKNYVEVTDFSDFAFTKSTSVSSTISYKNGYIPATSMLLCPSHNHNNATDSMKNSIGYDCTIEITPKGKTIWGGHAAHVNMMNSYRRNFVLNALTIDGKDSNLYPLWNCDSDGIGVTELPQISYTPPFEFPAEEVECEESKDVLPAGTKDINGGKFVSVRYPGRRYRLFRRTDVS